MYSGNHGHHGGSGFRLYLQRFLCSYRSLVAIFVVFLFTIFLYYYNESLSLLKSREIEGNRCQQKLDSISAQLQVVYEHKSRLEKALTGDREACTKKMEEAATNLKTAKEAGEKSEAELKKLKKAQEDLEKQMKDLKAEKEASEKAAKKADAKVAKANESHVKEIEAIKEENAKLNGVVLQLQTALNRSLDQMYSLQQQLEQQRQQTAYFQQQQQQPNPGFQQPINVAGVKEPAQLPNVLASGTQSILAAPLVNGSVPLNVQVPGFGAFPPRQPVLAAQPQPEQVALPMAERQQQQLLAQRQVPLQQQLPVGQAGAPAPVLQHPLGEDQQQLMMVRANNAHILNAPLAPGAPPVMQAPPPAPFDAKGQPLQQQAPPPAPVAQNAVPAPAAPTPAPVPDGDGGAGAGAGYHDMEPLAHHMDQNPRPVDEYRDDEEETRHKDFDTER